MLSVGSNSSNGGRFVGNNNNGVVQQRGGQMEDNELEEGEACFYGHFDPDVAFSYIDDKIQDVLGHFQKEFEGGVSSENLGSKFGGYGSFLPTHQRSPSVLLQPKTPAIVQNYNTQKSPNEGVVERMRSAAVGAGNAAFPKKATPASNNIPSGSAALAIDMANKGEMGVNVIKGSKEMFPQKKESVAKNVSDCDQKKLTVRIKVPPKNSEIHFQLGLEVSPSSSREEDSLDDREDFLPTDDDASSQSPGSLIESMTSQQILGEPLLTPLHEDLLKFPERDDKDLAKDAKNRMVKTEIQEGPSINRNDFDLGKDFQVSEILKGKSDENQRKHIEAKKENDTEIGKNAINDLKELNFENKMGRDLGSSNLKLPMKPMPKNCHYERPENEIIGDSGKDKLKGSNLSKEVVKGASKDKMSRTDISKDEHKEIDGNTDSVRDMKSEGRLMLSSSKLAGKQKELDQPKEEARKGTGNKDPASDVKKLVKECVKDSETNDPLKDLTGYREGNEQKDMRNEMAKEKFYGKAFSDEMTDKHKGNEKEHRLSMKKKHKDMNRKSNSSKEASKENSRDFTRESYKDLKNDKHAKDSATSEVFGEKVKAPKESKQATSKDYHKDYVKDVGQEQCGNRKDPLDLHRKDNLKESRIEPFERGASRVPEREKEREQYVAKVAASRKMDYASTSETHVSNVVVSQTLPVGAVGTDPGLVPTVPVVIQENWVQCDICEKWRLLPYGTEPSSLPLNWLCRMLDWLPGMNRCDISEDETTQALNAMYLPPPGQGQVDASRGQPQLPGAPALVPVLDTKQAEPNYDAKALKSINVSSNSKKGQAQRSIVNAPGSTSLTNSLSKKNKQSSIKSKSLNDVVQQPSEQVQGSIDLSHQAIKVENDTLAEPQKLKHKEKWKLKQNFSDEVGYDTGEGSTPGFKAKRKREGEPDAHKYLKKNKAEDIVGATGDFLDMNSIEKLGPNKITSTPGVKVKKPKDNTSPKRNIKRETREGLSAFKDQVQTSVDTESKGTCSGLDIGKVDRKDFSAKKRKMKEWKESQASQGGLPEYEYMKISRATVKEEGSETEHRREKKVKTSRSEGKESSVSKADGKLERKGKVTRTLPSSPKDPLPEWMEEQGRGGFEKEQEWGQPRVQAVVRRVSNGMDTFKRDTGYVQPFVAATSSSSKVSCSLKNLANFQEIRGSPVESVSSSPMRISKLEKPSLTGRSALGVDDSIDGTFLCSASPRRFSDGEGDAQSDRSGPVRKAKSSRIEQPGSHESCKALQSSVLNSGKIDESDDRDVKLFQDVNVNDKKSYKKMDRTSIDADHLGNVNNVTECLSERKEKEWSQEKIRDRHNTEGCQERKGSREKLLRDQDREREKNVVQNKGKDKVHDSVSDSHEDFYTRGKEIGRRSHDGPPESHVQSPYHEIHRCNKELVDDKRTNRADKGRRNDVDWNTKNDSRAKQFGEGRRGNQMKYSLDESAEVTPSDFYTKANRDFTSNKHQKSGTISRKEGKAKLQQSLQQDLSHGVEKASYQGLAERNLQSESATVRDKLLAIASSGDKPDIQGHGSAAVCTSNKSMRVEGGTTDASYGEFSRGQRESNRGDNSNGALNCRLKPPATNGVSGRDAEGAFSSPTRREHGQAAANCMKEAKVLKHTGDNIKNKGGTELESTEMYFNAALKFLKGASLLEPCNAESARHGETTQSMTVYTDTAKLCEYCALTYEKNKEMAAAALAYKCMGVAHMRVVISKNSCISRDRHELQMAFQNAPHGESPSSSASDIDNLNNHALIDKSSANPAKVAVSPQVTGDHVIVARHRALYTRVLQYTHDTIAAVEAFRKSESAFAAANGSLDGTEGISAVKRVMDFNFHDIDTLLHLVKLAMDAIYH